MRLPLLSCPAENVRGMMLRRLILPGGCRSSSAGNMILCRGLPEAKKRQPESGCLFFASGCNSRYALLPRRPVFFSVRLSVRSEGIILELAAEQAGIRKAGI